jgi:uncharacterized SAM-binding protein YcdF (DUF218 family)
MKNQTLVNPEPFVRQTISPLQFLWRMSVTSGLISAALVLAGAQPLVASTWEMLSPATAPPARAYAAMAYDPVSNKVVLFGGMGASANLNDTWAFDGTTWTQLTTTGAPPVRNGATMAFDLPTRKLVLFGGFDTNKYLRDTWIFDGASSTWTEAQMASPPPKAGLRQRDDVWRL